MSKKCLLLQSSWIFILLIVILFGTGDIWAATTGKIAGAVKDKGTGEPLPGVNVIVAGTSLGAASDLQGNFFIINVPPGVYSVQASMVGYQAITVQDVRVRIDQTAQTDFSLEQTAVSGQEVTVVAQRPPVEIDLTASKARISAQELANSYVTSVEQVVVQQSGVNIHGGVRGGFGLDVTYIIDGQEIRDGGTNQAFVTVPTSSIQEMELMTGGWNAEYPQASSGIVNVVTKSARNRIHGDISYRYRPSGKYHWGRNIYSKDNWEWWSVNPNGTPGFNSIEFWTTHDGGDEPYKSMTPEQRLAEWRKLISAEPTLTDYDKRADWDAEATVYGPITSKLGFLLSGRWEEGAPIFPNYFKYMPTWSGVGKLDYDLSSKTRIILTGWMGGSYNGGISNTIYQSSENIQFTGNPKGWFYSPYDISKFWPWGGAGYGGGEALGRLRPPEYIDQKSVMARLTHVFSPSTFLDASAKYYDYYYRADQQFIDKGLYTFKVDKAFQAPSEDFMANGYFKNVMASNDESFTRAWTRSTELKVDFTSQLNRVHQIRSGASFSSSFVDRYQSVTWIGTRYSNRFGDTAFRPWEAALYFQDKIELKGMIVNAGIRLDMYNANKKVGYTINDPYMLSDYTAGNKAINIFSFDPNSRWAVDTPTQVALSPRIGISHPISDNTVLHFMYGHFNQRPGWWKIAGTGTLQQFLSEPPPGEHNYTFDEQTSINENLPVNYSVGVLQQSNPQLDFERLIQYEVGFEQNIVDLLSLDVTMYYKDAKDQTTLGYTTDRSITNFDFTTGLQTVLYPDPTEPYTEGIPHQGPIYVPINGGYYNSRGIEFILETKFLRHANFRMIYNMLYSMSGKYGLSSYFRDFEGPTPSGKYKLEVDNWYGGSNGDQGSSGNTNQRWNPRNTFKVVAQFDTPQNFGPKVAGVQPLSNWFLSLFSEYASGQKFTYHSARKGDFSTEPNNEQWKGYYNTNLKLSKRIKVSQNSTIELRMDMFNVFNQKYLRLPGVEYGSEADLETYMEYGTLPKTSQTGEDDVWNWYSIDQLPRQIYFGIGIEF